MRMVLSFILSLCMIFTTLVFVELPASALSSSGSCGDNVSYTFDSSTGLLTISGSGDMTNYSSCGSPFYKDSSIKSVAIDNGVTSIGSSAFYFCSSLTSITIPNSVISIDNSAFSGCCLLTSITIPNSVTSIGDYAFSACSSLTSITIPNSITNIGNGAFLICEALTQTIYSGTIEKWCNVNIQGQTANPTYYSNRLIINNEEISKDLVIPDGVTTIGRYTFCGCSDLTSITIPQSVISIGECAFQQSRWLTNVYYCGTELLWNRISIDIGNDYIATAKKTFGFCSHKYTCLVVRHVTCTLSGIEIYTCAKCGDSYTKEIPALGHKTVLKKAKNATYFASGYTGDKICPVCGKTISKGKVIAKLKLKTPTVKYTSGKKMFKVKYTKVIGATGFEVSYTIGKKTYTKKFATTKSITKSISKLKKGSYKVKIRAFVKSSSKYAYSSYTKSKTIKVK